jgi:hypothetical protein
MLKNIFISKVRVRILKQYMFHPDEGYHVRGLVRLLKEEINAIRRELVNLKDAGILVSHKEGNKLIYKIDPECTIINDLRAMFYKDSEAGQSIISAAKLNGSPEAILMSPGLLDGKKEPTGELDILFVGEYKVNDLSRSLKETEEILGRELRYTIVDRNDLNFARKKQDKVLLDFLARDNVLLFGSVKDIA